MRQQNHSTLQSPDVGAVITALDVRAAAAAGLAAAAAAGLAAARDDGAAAAAAPSAAAGAVCRHAVPARDGLPAAAAPADHQARVVLWRRQEDAATARAGQDAARGQRRGAAGDGRGGGWGGPTREVDGATRRQLNLEPVETWSKQVAVDLATKADVPLTMGTK